MISRYIFICLYFISFFLINRWYDLYQYYFNRSMRSLYSHEIIPINQLNIKQLQYILNLRGITYVNINEKYDLIKMVEQTGSVRENELHEPLEDNTKHQTTKFSSYKQLLDFVDDCKDTIWFVHVLPNEEYRQSSIKLPYEQWNKIERRLSIFNIQTGILNCSNREYSNLCSTLNSERFILIIPPINRRSRNIYFSNIYSMEHYNYQYLLKWLSKTLENHLNKNFDWYELSKENRSILEFKINSNTLLPTLPIYYFTLFYRYGSIINFHLNFNENENFQLKFVFQNSLNHTYIYNSKNNLHELYSYRSLNIFLSYLTINIQTLIYMYFIILNIYFLYDIYLIESLLLLLKKFFIINIISSFIWFICLTCISTTNIDYLLQMISFYLIKYSQNSIILMYVRNVLFVYSIMSKWILYSSMILLHIGIGLCFRWYLIEQYGRITNDLQNNVLIIDQIHGLCSKIWQYILSFLFSDQGPNEHINNNNTFLHYFSQDSLWLNQYSSLTINPNVNPSIPSTIDFERLPIWRFTNRRRQTTHGASEYHSDIELEQSSHINEQDLILKKSFIHRRITNIVSLTQQDNFYTSESDENNNNSLNSNLNRMNSSEIYQCSICLEKYFHNVYICTLPCLHHFHRKCLFDWLCNSEYKTCPLCRSPVMN